MGFSHIYLPHLMQPAAYRRPPGSPQPDPGPPNALSAIGKRELAWLRYVVIFVLLASLALSARAMAASPGHRKMAMVSDSSLGNTALDPVASPIDLLDEGKIRFQSAGIHYTGVPGNYSELIKNGATLPGGRTITYLYGIRDLGKNGDYLFLAGTEAPLGQNFKPGLYLKSQGAIYTVLEEGMPAPGGGSFKAVDGVDVHMSSNGRFIAFIVETSGGPGLGVYLVEHVAGGLLPATRVAAIGNTAPGGGLFNDFTFVSDDRSPQVNNNGVVLFHATSDTEFYARLFHYQNATLKLVPDSIQARNVILNDSDNFTFTNSYPLSLKYGNINSIATVAKVGNNDPRGAAFTNFYTASLSQQGHIAFVGVTLNATSTDYLHGIYQWSQSGLKCIMKTNDAPPGGGLYTGVSSYGSTPVSTSDGKVYFEAATTGGRSIYCGNGGPLERVIGAGDSLEGLAVNTVQLDTYIETGALRQGCFNGTKIVYHATMTNGSRGVFMYPYFIVPEIDVEYPAGTALIDNVSQVNYLTVELGQTKTLEFKILNSGNSNLSGISTSITGANAGDFAVTTAPSTTVAGDSFTTVAVRFTPSAVGTRQASLAITSNDADENPFEIALSGSGHLPVNAEIVVEQLPGVSGVPDSSSIHFGNAAVGESTDLSFRIRNIGAQSLTGIAVTIPGSSADFSVTTAPAVTTLATGASTQFTVRFSPTAMGARSAALAIASNDPDESPFDIMLQGNGTYSGPEIIVKRMPQGTEIAADTSVDLGDVPVNASKDLSFLISNSGNRDLTGVACAFEGAAGDFSIVSPPPGTLVPGQEASVTVRFSPGTAAQTSARLVIASNDDDEGSFGINLGGRGFVPIVPDIAVKKGKVAVQDAGPPNNFGSITAGTKSKPAVFTIRNEGRSNLSALTVSLAGANPGDFTIVKRPVATLAPGKASPLSVMFTPKERGPRSATLLIGSNDPDEGPFEIYLTGIGIGPEIAVEYPAGADRASGSSASFSGTSVGNTTTYLFVIRNSGNAMLKGIGIKFTGPHAKDFSVLAPKPAKFLTANDDAEFRVQFAPKGAGMRTATMIIASSDIDERSFEIKLSGEGYGNQTFARSRAAADLESAADSFEVAIAEAGLIGDLAGPDAVPFADGVPNLLKYAFGMDLAAPDCHRLNPRSGTSGLPVMTTDIDGEQGALKFEYVRRSGSHLSYEPQVSGDLKAWGPLEAETEVQVIDGMWERVIYSLPVAREQRFCRVIVTIP